MKEEKGLKNLKISSLDVSKLYLRSEAKKYLWYYPKSTLKIFVIIKLQEKSVGCLYTTEPGNR